MILGLGEASLLEVGSWVLLATGLAGSGGWVRGKGKDTNLEPAPTPSLSPSHPYLSHT